MLVLDLFPSPTLHTERLVLRELRHSDAERVFAMRSDPAVMQHVTRPLAQTMADATALITLIHDTQRANDGIQWAITQQGEDAFIGMIGFWRMQKEHHRGELGYMLMPAYWGKGYMSEAIATAVEYGFSTLGFHRIDATTIPENVASMRALEKNGFRREGVLRESSLQKGRFKDVVHFGRLASDAPVLP